MREVTEMATKINADNMHFKDLNHLVSSAGDRDIIIENTLGQR